MSEATANTNGAPSGEQQAQGTPDAAAQAAAAEAARVAAAKGPEALGTPATTDLSANKDGEAVVYDPTGDAGLDYALGYVGKLGYGPDSPAIAAAMNGDFALIEAELAQKGDKAAGYKEVLALAKDAFEKAKAAGAKAAEEVRGYAHQAAGSEQGWNDVKTWASANAEPHEKAAVNEALAAGGPKARMAINWLVQCYQKSSAGVVEARKQVTKPGAAAGAGSGSGPLTAAEYRAELSALTASLNGRDPSDTPQYRTLQARRLAGMSRG